ncbi:MAG: hypothetical protein LBE57_04680 [Methanosarcinales archaeon]|jgi:hypothetical protein|nr:hypothetical protein [Methanosarcinales archaeon]
MKKYVYFSFILLLLTVIIVGCIDSDNSGEEERLDIPATLDDCYKALDYLLDEEIKEEIKNKSTDELFLYHFGLGMWIRNNWIYPAPNSRITKVFLDLGYDHPDDMSHEIIRGYHYYLNDIPYEPIEKMPNGNKIMSKLRHWILTI